MKLILSSSDFGNIESAQFIYDHLEKPISECKVLFFPNEKCNNEKIKSGKFHDRLSKFGFSKANIYVYNYFCDNDFTDINFDIIYISGGNTFGTLKLIRNSNAEILIKDSLNKGAIYIGGSAGAHIASKSIAHVEKYDIDTFGLSDFSGLSLFDGVLICHYSELRENDYKNLIATGEKVIALKDNESIFISE